MSFEILKADKAGACYGVKRALDIADEALKDGKRVATLGALIHNPKVVEDLRLRGCDMIDDINDADCDAVIIRSHGVAPQVFEKLESDGKDVIDATCPHVSRAQKAAAELAESGCCVLVVGESGHPEVEALKAYALDKDAEVHIVLSPEDIPENLEEPVGIVVQTTQSKSALENILEALDKMGIAPVVKDTICSATRKRQTAAVELAKKVDVMVVIGGKNSSNTSRLAELCQQHCAKTLHIESVEELNPDVFVGASTVGISAGASTPDDQIEETICHLMKMSEEL